MPSTITKPGAGYRYVPGVSQYSAGVAAEPGFRIERVRFQQPRPLQAGFAFIESHLAAQGRSLSALCACELRSPAPFTEAGFADFNAAYTQPLIARGLFTGSDNPIARTNVCPAQDAPAVPSVHAFSYTVPSDTANPSFVVAGSGEVPEGQANYRDHIVRRGDVSPDGLRAKARWVLDEMEARMRALGFGWADATSAQVYTVHDIHPFLADELVARGAARPGLTWHFCRPPVADLDFEMDVRGVHHETVIGGGLER